MSDSLYQKILPELKNCGYTYVRQGNRKSHEIWSNGTDSVSVPKFTDAKPLMNSIIKEDWFFQKIIIPVQQLPAHERAGSRIIR